MEQKRQLKRHVSQFTAKIGSFNHFLFFLVGLILQMKFNNAVSFSKIIYDANIRN